VTFLPKKSSKRWPRASFERKPTIFAALLGGHLAGAAGFLIFLVYLRQKKGPPEPKKLFEWQGRSNLLYVHMNTYRSNGRSFTGMWTNSAVEIAPRDQDGCALIRGLQNRVARSIASIE
jgi:hypothetical protein